MNDGVSPGSNDTKYFLIGVAVVVLFGISIFWYKHAFDPYSNPSPLVKQIKSMYANVYPPKGDIPVKEGTEAYTLNKNSITICLKDPITGKYYSWNTIAYVALHEMAHVITTKTEYGPNGKKNDHGPVFKRNFKKLLEKARQMGYYDPKQKIPDTYCGTH